MTEEEFSTVSLEISIFPEIIEAVDEYFGRVLFSFDNIDKRKIVCAHLLAATAYLIGYRTPFVAEDEEYIRENIKSFSNMMKLGKDDKLNLLN